MKSSVSVLIETLWNVKTRTLPEGVFSDPVLIETLWNVKQLLSLMFYRFLGINRNIVECKVKNTPFISQKDRVLIETLWNVKALGNLFTRNANPY